MVIQSENINAVRVIQNEACSKKGMMPFSWTGQKKIQGLLGYDGQNDGITIAMAKVLWIMCGEQFVILLWQ